MQGRRWRRAAHQALLGALVAALLTAFLALVPSDRFSGRDATPSLQLALQTGAQAQRAAPAPLSSASSPPPPDARAPATQQAAERLIAQWCGQGAQELSALVLDDAVPRSADAQRDRQALLDAFELRRGAVIARTREAWLGALRARPHARAQAIAHYLDGSASARQALQDLARRSTDSLITQLALARPCEAGACRNVDAAQWLRLEPQNLAAWMLVANPWSNEQLLDRLPGMAQTARLIDDHSADFRRELLPLLSDGAPSFELDTATGLLAEWWEAAPGVDFHPLTRACTSSGAASGPNRRACETLAELLWSSPSLVLRSVALNMASRLSPAGHPRHADWRRRSTEFDAAWQALEDQSDALAAASPKAAPSVCELNRARQQARAAELTGDEWSSAWKLASDSTAGIESLAARTRARRGGRSLLDE